MPLTKSIICLFAILAPYFVLGIPKEMNASCASGFSSVGGQNLLPYHDEENASDSFSTAKDLPVDLASDNYHTIDKLQSTIMQSMRSTTKGGRKLVRADSKTKIKKAHVKIVVYDKIKGYLNWMQDWFIQAARERCSTVCSVTEDMNQLKSADIVLFHGATHSFSYPDKRDAIFALLSMEQPKYAPILLNPAGLKHFDLLSTYSMEPVYPGTNIPNLPISYYPLNLVSASAVLSPPRPFISKTGFGTGVAVALFTSNCHNAGASGRYQYLEELAKHVKIHSYGKCLHNREEPDLPEDPAWPQPAQRRARKIKILSQYKFSLSFENFEVDDYVSEKVYEGLIAGSVPVYRGCSNIARFMPSPSSFINANNMTAQALGALLNHLAGNETAYLKYFAFKQHPLSEGFSNVTLMSYSHPAVLCRLCDFAYEQRMRST